MRVLAFPLDGDRFAVPIEAVREVVAAPQPTPLPTASAVVVGLFGVRAEIMPLLDTASLLGLPPLATWSYALVLTTAWGPAGLAVSGAPEVVDIDQRTAHSETHGSAGVWAAGDGLVVLLDPPEVVNPSRLYGAVA